MSASSSEPAAPHRASCATCKAVFRGEFRRCPHDGTLLSQGGADPLVGTVLAGRYQIEAVLGDGGLGRVYRARHTRMSRRFALKVPFGEVGYDRKARARLANEAEAASRLDHPNVIGIVDVGETEAGLFYLAMDLAEGEALSELIGDAPMPIGELLAIFAQLCEGLTHAHERGLIHRDLKPDNVMITRGDDGPHARVIDFGLALVDDGTPATRLTTEGLVVGTPCYMAPEQATGEALDVRTDLFALGIILYELLAGCLPFDGTPTDVARQNLSMPLPPIAERSGRAVDPLHEAVVTWLTQKRPADRPPSTRAVLELARALADGDRGAAIMALPPPLRPPRVTRAPSDGERLAPRPPAPPPLPQPDEPGAIVSVIAPPPVTPARRGRRRRAIALLLLALVAAVAVVVIVRRDRRAASAPPPIDAGVAVAVTPQPTDAAAPMVVDDPIDAAEPAVIAVPVDAGPSRPRPAPPVDAARSRPPPPVDAAPSRPPPPVDAAPAAAPVDDGAGLSLKAMYARVAVELDAAVARLGADRTAALRQRFDQVPPYADAARKPALRDQAQAQLRALLRDLAKLPR